MAIVRLWDGLNKTCNRWDNLRKDDDLWDPNGDCFVHLYSPGHSKRGPSFCVPLKKLVSCNLEEFVKSSRHGIHVRPVKTKRVRFSPQDVVSEPCLDLFVPAPLEFTKEETLNFHITTRNLLAWVLGEPLVGYRLGKSLVDLVERLGSYRANEQRNKFQVTEYAISQGYNDFRDSVEHSLGMLNFAEYIEDEKIWKEAFVHCVGMSAQLSESLEYQFASYKTTVLFNQSRRRMEIQIKNASRALSNFFHAELAGVHFSLAGDSRAHYDAFRTYLHTFYKERFSNVWPPVNLEADFQSGRPIILSMYAEFRNLYNYLVDSSSSGTIGRHESLNDDLDIPQKILSFDQKHRFETLKNSLPLLPQTNPSASSTSKRESLHTWRRRESQSDRKMQLVSLLRATNREDLKARACPLTLHYASFEKDFCLEANSKATLSLIDGRKVRWLLIYAIVQTLVSVLRAPPEVKDSITASYPLCCKLPRRLPWQGAATFSRTLGRSDSPASQNTPYCRVNVSATGAMETDLSYAIRKLALQHSPSLKSISKEPPMTIPSTFTQMPAAFSPFPAFSNTPFVSKRTALHSHAPSVFTSDSLGYFPMNTSSNGTEPNDIEANGTASVNGEHVRVSSESSTAATMTDASTRTDVSPISETARGGDLVDMDHVSITDEGEGDGDEETVELDLPPEEKAQIVRFLSTSRSVQTIVSTASPPVSREANGPRPHFDLVSEGQ